MYDNPFVFGRCYLNYDYLRSIPGVTPTYFGLGFIQLKLNENERIHFWTGHSIVNGDEIHDHRYAFRSTVLKGEVTHETFDFVPSKTFMNARGNFVMEDVSCDPNKPLENPTRVYGDIVSTGLYDLGAGSSYWFKRGQFHRAVAPKGTVTFLTRMSHPETEFARVVRGVDDLAICPFSETKDPDVLWAEIKEMLASPDPTTVDSNPGYHVALIPKGELGEISKIVEEVAELADAENQQATVMALVELGDLYGAVEAYLERHHPTLTMADLKTQADLTKRAFKNGKRR